MPEDRTAHSDTDPAALAARMAGQHVPDLVDVLSGLPTQTASRILIHLPHEQVVELFDSPLFKSAAEFIQELSIDQTLAVLRDMSADRAAHILRRVDALTRSRLLSSLDRETENSLRQLLCYPSDTAGSLMTTEFVSVPATWTVAAVLQHVRDVERTRESVYAIYVLDPASMKLVRTASLRRLIASEPDDSILSIAPDRSPIMVGPMVDREDVARLISRYDLLAVPVVDESHQILGIVTVDDIIDAMIEENTEDVQKFGGMGALERRYTEVGFLEMVRKRGGWLAALFMGEMLTASVRQCYETEIGKAIVWLSAARARQCATTVIGATPAMQAHE